MDIRDEVKKKITQHKHEPYFGNRISEVYNHIREVITRNGREHDPLTCPNCIESRASGCGPVCSD